MTLFQRVRLLLVFSAWWLACYMTIQKVIVASPFNQAVLTLPGEASVPFVPEALLVYASLYLALPFLYLMFDKRHEVLSLISAFGVCSVLHFMVFIFLPVRYVLRPELALADSGFINQGIGFIYHVDEPLNNFPSMHVSFSFLMYFSFRAFRPQYQTFLLIFAVAVSLSTVLVKQHYILDVVSAMALSYVVYLLCLKSVVPLNSKI